MFRSISSTVTSLVLFLVASPSVARAGYFVQFEFTGHVTQSTLLDVPVNSTFTGLFSYYTAGSRWDSSPASAATPIAMTLNNGPFSFSEVFTRAEGAGHSGAGVFLFNLGKPYTTTIQAEAEIDAASGSPQDFWLVSFTDNTGAVFTKPPPRNFELSSFSEGSLLYIHTASPDLPNFSGPIDSLVGTAVPLPEPSAFTLLGMSIPALFVYGRRCRKQAAG
jgi:hypothetical protein